MKKDMNKIGIFILIVVFILFYIISTFFLDRRNISRDIPKKEEETINNNYDSEINIVSSLYKDVRILYDVVNNKFKVDQDDTIVIGNVIYKKVINFDEIMDNLFTESGIHNYLSDLSSYFAYTDNGYYLAGNLVSYQTYYFRGDSTNIFISDSKNNEINGIIYEKWVAGNKSTLATIKVVYENNRWLIDKIDILLSE